MIKYITHTHTKQHIHFMLFLFASLTYSTKNRFGFHMCHIMFLILWMWKHRSIASIIIIIIICWSVFVSIHFYKCCVFIFLYKKFIYMDSIFRFVRFLFSSEWWRQCFWIQKQFHTHSHICIHIFPHRKAFKTYKSSFSR